MAVRARGRRAAAPRPAPRSGELEDDETGCAGHPQLRPAAPHVAPHALSHAARPAATRMMAAQRTAHGRAEMERRGGMAARSHIGGGKRVSNDPCAAKPEQAKAASPTASPAASRSWRSRAWPRSPSAT